MVISTKGRYALRVMVELAGAEPGAYVALKDIAGRQEISEKYLEAIMKRLGRAGLVSGLRGKGGGYRLAADPARCTVGDILRAAEDSLAPVACQAWTEAAAPAGTSAPPCPSGRGWRS